MHLYRTHTCGALRLSDEGKTIRLSGWVHRKRDHGHLLFIDLRDHYGLTQCVIETKSSSFKDAELVRLESVVTITGKVVKREAETINSKMPTGEIEVVIQEFKIDSIAEMLPLQVNSDQEFPEETRLRYRYLDLRREKMHNNIILRSTIISEIRKKMTEQGFLEIQTPILTASSPEGARDFLVPSRLHPGMFYALPQAPQMFKQLLMMSGFDRYFQIAPCFRDEDARADRSPGEFYQLDFEMAYVTQEDVFSALEPVLHHIFTKFGTDKSVTSLPFPRIPFEEAMLKYGSDKPDLRNPLLISDVTDVFRGSDFSVFSNAIEKGNIVRAIQGLKAASRPRSFFDKLNGWAQEQGAPGLGYITFSEGAAKGPIAKFLNDERMTQLKKLSAIDEGDAVFFVCAPKKEAEKLAGAARQKIADELDIREKNTFRFCWVTDFPMFEWNEDQKKIDFSHNPFSMPQGGLEALENQDPLTILAYQYDIVCNGVELSSGAIRNHKPEIMYKAFNIAGYSPQELESRFGGMINALKFGAPPHGGSAPGIDRIVMLLADEENLREVTAFPMNQQGQDLMMQAPNTVYDYQLKELHIALKLPPSDKK
ncbi:aspartate--tRNA ligase [Candidatus Nucleicultrix amoebiphila]|jgi:aspartyl-tRNA synthetase|uniref:Aspartate--tRNA(Asp/Asn) ligase n=1 Tax=Candidatus Nucleicultrix amoebiphila FS5 TaxID=1414854 RepID=A0A1W6N3E7_9PROT|nr:aspartate--tRNA ligase [Candidatus Nucleicultrix amoebiphila]ARN84309.1 aspartyl-tRNA synthetase [Candidatus Nucleicultrix amoebiphila FS5]